MNNLNENTGNKGVFPGVNTQTQQHNSKPNYNNTTNNQSEVLGVGDAQQNQQTATHQNVENQNIGTYIKLETKNQDGQISGVIEIDLISFRERGVESRYLSVNTMGVGVDGNPSQTTIAIDNEDDFNLFKEFISNLNWND